ncbi:MAG: response regulator [Spirochaetales bacterium]|nr:response regulator [Spirochaetales bacterium]
MSEERILVVEDDVISAEALCDKLSGLGYRVPPPAATGEEAVDRAGSSPPDLILMDIRLAGKLDGIGAAELIQARQDVPVLYLTAYTDEETLKRAKVTAPYSYLVKPVRDRELHITVEMALHRHRLEKALREQYTRLREVEKLRDDLIHMVVHDMRSPLTVILGNLELTRIAVDSGRPVSASGLEAAWHGAEALMEMIDALLDVNRLEEGKMPINPIECDLYDLAGVSLGAYRPLAEKKNLNLTLEGAPAQLRADPALIRRVLDNLVGNAVKFTPTGGRILVSARTAAYGVRAEVSDSGPPLPPESYRTIFEKFGQIGTLGQDQTHSTGLGLTFCKLAVEAHGGKIGVESELGRGNTFWFTLPA